MFTFLYSKVTLITLLFTLTVVPKTSAQLLTTTMNLCQPGLDTIEAVFDVKTTTANQVLTFVAGNFTSGFALDIQCLKAAFDVACAGVTATASIEYASTKIPYTSQMSRYWSYGPKAPSEWVVQVQLTFPSPCVSHLFTTLVASPLVPPTCADFPSDRSISREQITFNSHINAGVSDFIDLGSTRTLEIQCLSLTPAPLFPPASSGCAAPTFGLELVTTGTCSPSSSGTFAVATGSEKCCLAKTRDMCTGVLSPRCFWNQKSQMCIPIFESIDITGMANNVLYPMSFDAQFIQSNDFPERFPVTPRWGVIYSSLDTGKCAVNYYFAASIRKVAGDCEPYKLRMCDHEVGLCNLDDKLHPEHRYCVCMRAMESCYRASGCGFGDRYEMILRDCSLNGCGTLCLRSDFE